MATTKQKQAARKNLEKARAARSTRPKRASSAKRGPLSTADKNDLPTTVFAFPDERKEPLNDAKHVRNAVARFDQVEGVTDAERAKAWKRIKAAAKRYDVEIEASSWRELMAGGRAGRSNGASSAPSKKKKKKAKKKDEKKKDRKKKDEKNAEKKNKKGGKKGGKKA